MTGRRMRTILALSWQPKAQGGWIDVERGTISFKGNDEIESKKGRGDIRMPQSLHLMACQWVKDGNDNVIHFKGRRISDVGTAFDSACAKAGVEGATPHTLKHTAIAWAFQEGMAVEDAEAYFATSAQTLLHTYRKHSPHHSQRAVETMDRVGGIFADNIADFQLEVATAS